jgi:pyruvate dehydrogenase E1 component beta subunit
LEDVPMPYNHTLELAAQISAEKIVTAAKGVLYLE